MLTALAMKLVCNATWCSFYDMFI